MPLQIISEITRGRSGYWAQGLFYFFLFDYLHPGGLLNFELRIVYGYQKGLSR